MGQKSRIVFTTFTAVGGCGPHAGSARGSCPARTWPLLRYIKNMTAAYLIVCATCSRQCIAHVSPRRKSSEMDQDLPWMLCWKMPEPLGSHHILGEPCMTCGYSLTGSRTSCVAIATTGHTWPSGMPMSAFTCTIRASILVRAVYE